MSAQIIGRVKSPKGKTYEVKWDSTCRDVYVSVAGWSRAGKASSAAEAMNRAEAFVYNR